MPPITKPAPLPARIEEAPLPPHERARSQGVARVLLVLVLAALGLWILHRFLPALVWAVVLAIALFPLYNRLERRLLEIDKFDPKAKRQITQLLDSFIEAEKLKHQMKARTTPSTKPRAQRNQASNAQEAQA